MKNARCELKNARWAMKMRDARSKCEMRVKGELFAHKGKMDEDRPDETPHVCLWLHLIFALTSVSFRG